ncbi:uracil phosphoribosyltransferase [Ilumatobacter coccineus]|uniref:Uracil phosphoribosyltransferase n=1 Tax=Ilumatobacter coccineus (strain NBRC 103263 / KCTC 29153 / YM16-304) TaxID=1313172 RepID=A0A6C7E8A4_ILUCY|nr:uracil phosphoribosyltransferase [Ilumatobacter coccineus]BAN01429.1 uracil phosphoribosyltransferase [Ilumatobacter coccineus YM16-304]
MTVHTVVVDHPLVLDALATIRNVDTPNALFRQNLERIGMLLIAEATQSLPTVVGVVTTPLTETSATRLAVQPIIVPILRAGLGFLAPAQQLLPNADVGFIGIARNEETHQPEPYVNKLPDTMAGRPVIVVDPMLATGGSLIHTLELLIESGAEQPLTVVCALCAPEGIEAVEQSGIDVVLYTASIDDHLNENAYIVPGLGDAGDRQF